MTKSEETITKQGYKIITNKEGKRIFEHRQVWIDNNGEIPLGFVIHHKDGNKLNNNIENLKLLSNSKHSKCHYKYKSTWSKRK